MNNGRKIQINKKIKWLLEAEYIAHYQKMELVWRQRRCWAKVAEFQLDGRITGNDLLRGDHSFNNSV